MANLMKFRRIQSRSLPLAYFLTNYMNKTLLGLLSRRASEVLGPISRSRVADIVLHMKLVSRASGPGLTVGILRILCHGLCTALRFRTEEHDQTCRVGCPNEPDSLSHITMSVPGCTTHLLLSGDMLLYFHREIISYMT